MCALGISLQVVVLHGWLAAPWFPPDIATVLQVVVLLGWLAAPWFPPDIATVLVRTVNMMNHRLARKSFSSSLSNCIVTELEPAEAD